MAWLLTGYFCRDDDPIMLVPTREEVLEANPGLDPDEVCVMKLRLRNAGDERIERYRAEGFQLDEVWDA